MPLSIILDVSLSMSRLVSNKNTDTEEVFQRKHLAIHGINTLLDHLTAHSKLEFVSLITFSSLYEILCSFTRDYDLVRSKLATVEEIDKTCLEAALHGVSALINEEWGQNTSCHVILITDGSNSLNVLSLARRLSNTTYRNSMQPDDTLPLPFNFPAKFHVVTIASTDEPSLSVSLPLYQKLVDLSGAEGGVIVPEGPLSMKSVQNMFTKLAESHFSSFQGNLCSGMLTDSILLYPAPQDYHHVGDMEVVQCKVSKDIVICGFVDLVDVASPPAVSRHLVLPVHTSKSDHSFLSELKSEADMEEDVSLSDEGKSPSFCVLLHGALKVENMGALCRVADNWYGLLYSWADSKKKSNLMLSIFEPGNKCIPWLGDLSCLGPLNEADSAACYGSFPVKPAEKRSYAQSCVVWVQPGGLQADIQKILRHARKMPDKTQHFYKELNRLRRAALSLGFTDLMDTMSVVLERECTLLPHNAHPDCALQLTNAANLLRSPQSRNDLRHNITALRTKFTHDD